MKIIINFGTIFSEAFPHRGKKYLYISYVTFSSVSKNFEAV